MYSQKDLHKIFKDVVFIEAPSLKQSKYAWTFKKNEENLTQLSTYCIIALCKIIEQTKVI